MSFPLKKMLVSSANSTQNNLSDTLEKSFIYSMNNNRPRMDPCGTPYAISRISDFF